MENQEEIERLAKDPLIRHEFMDRSAVALSVFEVSISDHAGIHNGRLKELAERVTDALSDLYREASKFVFEEPEGG